jgi:type II secretory pathway pseudopilin PulG
MMREREAGFTLVEALVAMAMAAVVTLAIAMQMAFATAMISGNRHASHAVALAQDVLEDLRTLPYDDISDGSKTVTRDGTTFTADWVVAEQDAMKDIVVTVSWQSKGATKTYVLETIFTEVE